MRMLIAMGELEIDRYEEEGEGPPLSVTRKLSRLHEIKDTITTAIDEKQVAISFYFF